MQIKYFKKIKIPDKPGVYLFKKGKEIFYIGKATSLKDRVRSYFGKDLIGTRGPLLVDMVFRADSLDWQVADSVLEAVILEANLIKRYQPKYNTKEKDDKSFNYVCVTRETLPRVIVARGKDLKARDFSSVFGPYTSGPQLREALKIVRRIFPFLDDKSKNYLEFYKQINLVPDLADLPAQAGRRLYLENIKNIKLFFSGKKKQILKNLHKEMKAYAKIRAFEKAAEIKRQIFALQHINDVALLKNNFANAEIFDPAPFFGRIKGNKAGPSDTKISAFATPRSFRIEAYDIAHMSGKNMVGAMVVVENGVAVKSEYKRFKIRTQSGVNDIGALTEVLERRLAHREWRYPDLIVVDGSVAQMNAAKKVLNKFKIKIGVVGVIKDERHKPKAISGNEELIKKYKSSILLSNSEAHRFAITYHKNMRAKNFIS